MSKNSNFKISKSTFNYSNQEKGFKMKNENSQSEVLEQSEELLEPVLEETTVETTEVLEENIESVLEKSKEIVEQPKEDIKKLVSKTSTKQEFTPVYNVQTQLVSYMEAMLPSKAIDPAEGGKWQYHLYSVFKQVLNANSQEEFNSQFNTILHFFRENKESLFNHYYMTRFPEHFTGSDKEFKVFRSLAYLIIETCDVKTRKKNLEKINLETLTSELTEAEKQKLINFYLI